MLVIRRRGLARLGRRAAVVGLLDLAIIIGVGAHMTGGIATGASPDGMAASDPFQLLGLRLGETSCPTAPLAVGKDSMAICPAWTAVVSPSGIVQVVSVYGPGNPVVDAFDGALPGGLQWGDTATAAWTDLGRPNRITGVYGSPTLVYFFDGKPYGSLELRFDDAGHLTRINAELVH